MGLLGDIWNLVKGSETVDMMFVRDLGATTPAQPFEQDKCYVELFVNSLRIRNARKFTQKFDGVVYTFVSLPFEADARVKVPAVSKPENLVQLDPGGINKVIPVNKTMMGAMPWRGGNLMLELGLFSVKGGNLLSPVLDFMTELSETAGVSFIGKITPFAPLISKGVGILAGQTQDVALEVGLDITFPNAGPGTHAIIAAPKDGSISAAKLTIDPADGKLLHDGQALKAGYCVFTLSSTTIKADYGEIPELKEKFAAFRAALRTLKEDEAKEKLAAFRVAALTSPDLIRTDAARLVNAAEAMMADVFAGGGVAAGDEIPGAETLAGIQLYA